METIIQIIQQLGFPIAMTLLVFWRMTKESDNHKEEVNALKETLAENTIVLSQLKQLIEDKMQ